jgi:hypothetical protein
VQLRPPIHVSLHETGCLDRFEHTVVIEVGELGVPSPPTAGESQGLAQVAVGCDAALIGVRSPVLT